MSQHYFFKVFWDKTVLSQLSTNLIIKINVFDRHITFKLYYILCMLT